MSFTAKEFENFLLNKCVVLNEGVFLLRVSKTDVEQSDFLKQCLYGDAFPSAYSQNVSMVPTGIFLPQMISDKNVFFEHKVETKKVPFQDTFTQHAFLIHDSGHRQVKEMYDNVLSKRDDQTYSVLYDKVLESVRTHEKKLKRTVSQENELEMLLNTEVDEETQSYLADNDEYYTVMFATQTASVRLQLDDHPKLRFGSGDATFNAALADNSTARIDAYTDSENCVVTLSERVTRAIKRELLTMTQLYAGYCKQPGQSVRQYLQNTMNLYSNQLKAVECQDEDNIESYSVSALKVWLSGTLEIDDINTSWSIIGDSNYEDTLREKILFQLLMVLDRGSCFNSRQLSRRDMTEEKASIICTSTYTNPANELKNAVYGNLSMVVHLTTECLFFARTKLRVTCESCQQKYCAVSIPSLMFKHTPNVNRKKERSTVVACFNTSSIFNKTGPIGDLVDNDSKGSDAFSANKAKDKTLDKKVDWDKHYRELFSFLCDNVSFDLKSMVENTPTTRDNIDERAEKMMNWIGNQLENVVQLSEQFCKELDDGAESITKTSNVEVEMKNVYSVQNLYNGGFMGILLSESLLYFLRCIVLYQQKCFENQTVHDVFLKVKLLLLDNKSGFTVNMRDMEKKQILMQKIVMKTYTEDGDDYITGSKSTRNYQLGEILHKVSYKCKVFLFGRYDEKKKNGNKESQPMLQNMSSRKPNSMSATSVGMGNNSFMHFKTFCTDRAVEALAISSEDDEYCRQVLKEYRDDVLWEYAPLFRYVKEYKIDNWTAFFQLVSVMKLLEYLRFQPSFDRITFTTFNRLTKKEDKDEYVFVDDKIGEEFEKMETLYGINCTISEFTSVNQTKKALYKKCAGKYLESQNDLLNDYSRTKMYPGCPIYYLPLREKNNVFKQGSNDFVTKFINEDQYLQEKDAQYTSYIVRHRRKFFDCLFDITFADQGRYIEDRYNQDVLDEMLTTFDENYPVSVFVSEQMHSFLRLVLSEYLNPDQNAVQVMVKRIKEIHMRVKNRANLKKKRQREEEEDAYNMDCTDQQTAYVGVDENDEDEDAEDQFLRKRRKIE